MRLLLACGTVAPALALVTDLVACARWSEYRPINQSLSQLSAIGAPTRQLVTGLDLARDGLLAAFAAGVGKSARGDRALGAAGGLLLANAATEAFATAFVPRDFSQPTWSARNTANTLVMGASVACSLGAMGMGARALPGWFRRFSAGVPLSYLALAVLGVLLPARRAAAPPATGEASATTGAQERTMAYSFQLWVAVLAVTLARRDGRLATAR
jgi:hypothetical protein